MTTEASNKAKPNTNDAATEKAKKKRRTKIYRYPSNIGSDEQPHAINFYIFQTESTAQARDRVSSLEKLSNSGDADAASQLKAENGRQSFLGTVASASFGVTAATLVDGGAIKKGGVAGISSFAANELFKKAGATQTRTTRKIDSSISLYIPNSPQAKYGAEFNIEDLGTIMGGGMAGDTAMMQTFNQVKDLIGQGEFGKALEAAAESPLGSVLARTISSAGNIPKELGLGDLNISGAIRSATRTIRNPYKEQIFQTMGFRSFAFEYKFAPRNEKELRDVMEIVKLFKSHMHPEKEENGLFFTFPSEFQIEYVYKNRENTYLNKIAPCFLTDLSVDYGNGGTFTTFKDARGAPSEITMSMAFKETELLTRSKVEEGF